MAIGQALSEQRGFTQGVPEDFAGLDVGNMCFCNNPQGHSLQAAAQHLPSYFVHLEGVRTKQSQQLWQQLRPGHDALLTAASGQPAGG